MKSSRSLRICFCLPISTAEIAERAKENNGQGGKRGKNNEGKTPNHVSIDFTHGIVYNNTQ